MAFEVGAEYAVFMGPQTLPHTLAAAALARRYLTFWVRTMLVEPGLFRTELLTPQSTQYAEPSIEDYADRTEQIIQAWKSMDGLPAFAIVRPCR